MNSAFSWMNLKSGTCVPVLLLPCAAAKPMEGASPRSRPADLPFIYPPHRIWRPRRPVRHGEGCAAPRCACAHQPPLRRRRREAAAGPIPPPLQSGGGGGEADGGGITAAATCRVSLHPLTSSDVGARDAPSVTAQIAPRHLPRAFRAGEEMRPKSQPRVRRSRRPSRTFNGTPRVRTPTRQPPRGRRGSRSSRRLARGTRVALTRPSTVALRILKLGGDPACCETVR